MKPLSGYVRLSVCVHASVRLTREHTFEKNYSQTTDPLLANTRPKWDVTFPDSRTFEEEKRIRYQNDQDATRIFRVDLHINPIISLASPSGITS